MKLPQQVLRQLVYFAAGVFIGSIALVGGFYGIYANKIFPGIKISGIEVGGMTKDQAREIVETKVNEDTIAVSYGESQVVLETKSLEPDVEGAIEKAYSFGRDLALYDLIGRYVAGALDVAVESRLSDQDLYLKLAPSFVGVEIEMIPPEILMSGDEIIVKNGTDGLKINEDEFTTLIKNRLGNLGGDKLQLPLEVESAQLTQEKRNSVIERASKISKSKLIVNYPDESFSIEGDELVGFVDPLGESSFSEERVMTYVDSLTENINRSAQNARFNFEDGRVSEFTPHRDGLVLKVEESSQVMIAGLEELESQESVEIELAVERIRPNVTSEDVNDLGINELLGRGVSYYRGSIPNRVYNVGLAASRLNGILLAPGEEFSFNNSVGEVSAATGFKSAYVISNGRTILGDGGGVCQDSTTLFRAVMDAGLPITERWAHSYRVGYYEQNAEPGFDATVYAPSKDFRFVNDTPGHILIQATAYEQNRKLVFEIYGTSDGRKSYVSEGKLWDVTPPPPDLYQDDPSLPSGTVKQVDWSAWGAKASFSYEVERDGETIFSETYNSVYRPWQNVFLVGTGS